MPEVKFPAWASLTPKQRAVFENGVGSNWMPDLWRCKLTSFSLRFFREASWSHHDYGYYQGGTELDRLRYDWRFYKAMRRDAKLLSTFRLRATARLLSVAYFLAVRSLGWCGFAYGGNEAADTLSTKG